MTRFIPLAATVLGVLAPAAVQAQKDGKPTVAIMSFDNGSYGPGRADYEGLSKGVPAMLITDMTSNANIRVIERAEVQKLVDEQKLTTSGAVDKETAVKVGKLLGAQHMIFGTFITDPKGNFRIDAKAVNVETGAIEHVERVDDKADNIMPAIGKLASQLNNGMHLPMMAPRRTGDASPAMSQPQAPAATGAQQSSAPATMAPAANPKIPMRVAVLYGKALDAKDKGNKAQATELFGAVLKEFPNFPAAEKEFNSMKKG